AAVAFSASAISRAYKASRDSRLPRFSAAWNAKSFFSQRWTVVRSTPAAAAASVTVRPASSAATAASCSGVRMTVAGAALWCMMLFLLVSGRPDHRHDAGADRLRQRVPTLDHQRQVGSRPG